ncbi:MAG: hypothetical protein A2148_04330 [Chloroflexi bacterium RBG_16_68_14]|nr:MAG: hypothetical protein A2148_04330 [Chloroflexi bacterium RBG_16_68_14]
MAAIAALVVFLFVQAGRPGSNRFAEAAAIEADPAPDLPGEWVNLPKAYGGFYGNNDGPNTGQHVTREVDYANDCSEDDPPICNSTPPTGGPHWGSSACPDDPEDAPPFCGPAPWGVFRKPWDAETLVHNMEHGGVVLWYNTTDQQIIDELEQLIGDRLDNGELLVMAPYSETEEETIALTAWARIDKFSVNEYSQDRVKKFIDAFRCRFNPESMRGLGC